jgi:hypothetical protein
MARMADGSIVPFRPRDAEPVRDTSFEVALDDYPEPGPPVPVDPAPEPGALLPVIPPALATVAGAKRELARHAGRQVHRVKYHGLRSPWYLAKTLGWAHVGAGRLFWRWVRWWLMPVPASVHADAVAEGHRAWKTVFGLHLKVTKHRAWISLAVGVPLLSGSLYLWFSGLRWVLLLAAVPLVAVLAHHGRPVDKPIIGRAVITPRFRVLNADVVLRAYYAAGLGHREKADQQVEFGGRPMRRDGEGSGVDVDLPYGKGLKDAIAARDAIASGLDVQVSQVFLHRDKTSNRRHYLWVADRDPLAVPVGRTPLLACRPTDIWKAAPLGLDERGQMVTLPLIWHSVLVGALPRQGKSWTARLLGLFAALDPYVKLDVFDAAAKPDWRKFALVADSCAFGLTPTKEGLPPEILLDTLRRIKAEVQDRYNRLSELPTSICPEGKLTRKIARDPRFGMPVRLLLLDEFQEFFDLGKISTEIAEGLRFLVKVAPAAGVIPVWSTQKPAGIGSGELGKMFNATRDNFIVRFSLRTASWTVSEAVLGQGTYGMGLDSSQLLAEYKGVGILHGASDASPTVRCYKADDQDAERILLAARGLREKAGTLSGYAAGAEVATPVRDVLGDVLACFRDGEAGVQWAQLAERLARRFPDRWQGATQDSVSAECRALDVPSVDVRWLGRTLKGCRKADVERVSGG